MVPGHANVKLHFTGVAVDLRVRGGERLGARHSGDAEASEDRLVAGQHQVRVRGFPLPLGGGQ